MRNIFATVLCIAAAAISTTSTPTRNDALGASGIVFSSTTNNSQSGFPMPSGPNGQSSNITTAGGGSVVIGSGVAFIPAVGPVNLSSSTTSTYMSLLYGPVNASNPVFSPPIQGPNNASSSNFFQTASCGGNGVTTNVTYQFSSVASLTGPANSTTSLSYSWTGTGNSGPFSGSATFLYSYGNSSTALPYWVDQTPIVAGSSAGMVLSGTTKVYVIYYGALTYGTTYWTNSAKTTLINNFISQLSNSAWFSTAKQYGVGNMVLGKTITVDCFNTGRDGNRYVSPGSCTMRPDPTTKQNFVSQIIWRNIYLASDDINGLSPDFLGIKEVMDPTFNHFLLPKDPNGIYLVLGGPETYEQWAYPSGATIGQSYCGYHGQFSADAVGDNVYQYLSSNVSTSPFYNLPYPRKDGYVYNYIYAMVPVSYSAAVAQPGGMTPNLPSKCVTPFNANNSPNGFPEIDSLLGVIAHELVETLVSPAPFQTFSDTEGNEVMDK